MVCPMCLEDVKFREMHCPVCKQKTSTMYVDGYRRFPPVVVNAIGFRRHGKTVYFASLFYLLKQLAGVWPEFYTTPLTERAIDTISHNIGLLQDGALPDATPKNFPQPTVIRAKGMPRRMDRSLLFFDTAGECFERPSQLVQYAGFVRRARTAMFLVSVPDLQDPASEMDRLLDTYLIGMSEMRAETRAQNLCVVFTKADRLVPRLQQGWTDLLDYLVEGSIDGLKDMDGYMARMRRVSDRLLDFTQHDLRADEFLNAARSSFRNVDFSIISSLGADPRGGALSAQIVPRRVIDPLLWMIERSSTGWRRLLREG